MQRQPLILLRIFNNEDDGNPIRLSHEIDIAGSVENHNMLNLKPFFFNFHDFLGEFSTHFTNGLFASFVE